MLATPLSLTARTLHAELRELALAVAGAGRLAPLPGGLVRKSVKGETYVYYQYRDLDGRTRQAYLGASSPDMDRLEEGLARRAVDLAADQQQLEELRAAFVGAGATVMEHAPLRVLQGFVDAGVLQPGRGHAVLVGTHAFNVLGNLLGVRWASQMQTQDIDLAGEADMDIAVAQPDLPVPDVLARLEMGLIPVPALDVRQPSTSFRIRGQEMRVDLLAPLRGKPRPGPIFVPAFNAVAQPLRYLDYLIEAPVAAVVVGRKSLALVNVPAPERFALHKLLVSESREAVFATKAEKDRLQAVQLLEVLLAESPDGLTDAKQDLVSRGKGWSEKLERALGRCERMNAELVAYIRGL